MADSSLTKSARARAVGIARSTLYYRKMQPQKDWVLKVQIEEVLRAHPSYGHRRIATALGRKDERPVLRVMKLFGIKPYHRHRGKWKKPKKQKVEYPNLLMGTVPIHMHDAWAADFTHLGFHGTIVYVATVLDVYSRIVLGLSVLTTHAAVLVTQALWSALLNNQRPTVFHSDNGSEYDSAAFKEILTAVGITISRSKPGCPWENGYQESFYDKFKVELGDPNRFETLGELVAEIYRTVHYYNTERIHSAFNMPPREFARRAAGGTMQLIV